MRDPPEWCRRGTEYPQQRRGCAAAPHIPPPNGTSPCCGRCCPPPIPLAANPSGGGDDAGLQGVAAIVSLQRLFGGTVGHLRGDGGFGVLLPIPDPGFFRPGAIGTADAAQLADAHPAGALQVSPHRLDDVDAGGAPHHGNAGGNAEFYPLRCGQRALRPPEFGVGALVIDLLRQIIPVVPVFKQVFDEAMASVAVGVHQTGQNRMAAQVDDPTRLRQNRKVAHGADSRNGVLLHCHISRLIDGVGAVHCDDTTVDQQ